MHEIKEMLEQIKQRVIDQEYVEGPQYIEVDFNSLQKKLDALEEMIRCR